jgi:3-deoxy-D-arabino-heptulosonate 7-phosphate (DAHP) synthase
MTHIRTDDTRIEQGDELLAPMQLMRELKASETALQTTFQARNHIHDVLRGADDRLVVVVGPCSIHDPKAALEYARKLKALMPELERDLVVVMRVYFEKPRTTVGWKGLINDPHMDESFDINEGLRLARKLLLDINEMGLPCGTEFLDLISPQYIADLVAWGAIGARTTESQSHRQLASGLSCPVGFKNGTDGNLRIAVDAIKAGRRAPPLRLHHQVRPRRGVQDRRQRGLPRHPARRQAAQLRCRQRQRRLRRAGRRQPAPAGHDRLLPRQFQQAVPAPDRRGRRRGGARWPRATSASWA